MAERLKLQGKLIALFLILSLIPLSVISYMTYRQGEQRVRDHITGHLKSIVEKDAELLDSFLTERLADLKVLSETIRPGDTQQAESLIAHLRAMRKEYKVYRQISIIDPEGRVIAADGTSEYEDEDISEMEWFKEAVSGRDYVSEVFLSRHDEKPLLLVSTHISNGEGDIRGVTAAHIDFGYVNRVLRAMELGNTGEAYLINKAGYFLTHSRLGGRILEDRIPAEEEHIYLGNSGISEHIDYRGKMVLCAHEWVPNREWVLVAEQDSEEAFREVRSFRSTSIFIGIAVAMVVFVVAFFVSSRIDSHLKKSYDQIISFKKYNEDIIDSVPMSIVVLDKDLRIIHANRDFHEKFHTKKSDIKGRILTDMIPNKELEERIREARDRSSQTEALEIEHELASRGKKILSIRAVPAHLGGNMHILLTITDVTEKKTMETQMQRAEKLSSLGTLTAGVAHELNTPLANILLNTQILIEEVQNADAASIDTLKIIEEQARQGGNIVRGLLEFSRQSELVSEAADVNEILDNMFEITENQLRLSKITLVNELDRSIPRMETDIGKLQQVFMNIISNAIWAMPDGGRLTVGTRFDKRTCRIKIEFSDTGCGIKKENLGKIFDPFFTTKEAGKGTGLGLAVSYGIVEEMGGDIEVSSVPAEEGSREKSGTTFIVKLPVPGGINGDQPA